MKRIISIFTRDIKNSFRDYMMLYMILAPILLTIGLRFFIPSAQSAALQFAIDKGVGNEVITEFEQYGSVEIYSTKEEIKNRVLGIDDTAGIYKDDEGKLQVILEGNESHDTEVIPQMIIRDLQRKGDTGINIMTTDIGVKGSPVAIIGAISMILIAVLIGGILIGFNIIEEKETNTIKALNVTPMTKFEFIAGRSLSGIIIPIFQVYIILWILGMLNVNKSMVLIMTVVSSLIAILIGFLIGVISSNQISGIANMKGIFVIISLSIVGALILPESKHFILYWSPLYWSFIGFRDILLDNITWTKIGTYSGWILGINLLVFLSLGRRIKKGLA